MKILLVNPFIYDFAAFDLWAKPRGLLEVGRIFQELGHDVELLDCMDPSDAGMAAFVGGHHQIQTSQSKDFGASSYFREELPKPDAVRHFPRRYYRYGFHPDYLRKRLAALNSLPSLVGVTGIMTYWSHGVHDTILIIKEMMPQVPVVLGGIYPTLLLDYARRHAGADLIFTGSATHERIKGLLCAINRSHSAADSSPASDVRAFHCGADVPSADICALVDKAVPSHNVPMPEINIASQVIDSPFPAPSVFYPYPRPAYGITALTEGCQNRCSYCASWILYRHWNQRDPAQCLAEAGDAWQRGCRDLAFYDDDLLFRFEEVLHPFLAELKARGWHFRLHTPNGLYLNRINPERARILFEAGFQTLRFGFETADSSLSTRIGHKIGQNEFSLRIQDLFQAGFRTDQIGIYLLAGLPGQSPESVEESIRFVRSCGLRANLCEYSPVPGTPLYADAKLESMLDLDADPFFQNNTLLPLRSKVFTVECLNRLKNLCR